MLVSGEIHKVPIMSLDSHAHDVLVFFGFFSLAEVTHHANQGLELVFPCLVNEPRSAGSPASVISSSGTSYSRVQSYYLAANFILRYSIFWFDISGIDDLAALGREPLTTSPCGSLSAGELSGG